MNNQFAVISSKALHRYSVSELGKEKLCIHCGDYWPLTNEFWFFQKHFKKWICIKSHWCMQGLLHREI